MKFTTPIALCVGICLFAGIQLYHNRPLPDTSVEWLMDYQQASSTSKRENKPMLVKFYADWCSSCKALERDTLRTPQVETALREVVPVSINVDQADPELASRFAVNGIPALFLIGTDGRIKGSLVGTVDAGQVLNLLEKAK